MCADVATISVVVLVGGAVERLGGGEAEQERGMDSTEDGSLMPSVSSVDAEGSMLFRHRLVCSLLSGKALHISNIRSSNEKPGLRCTWAMLLLC